MTNIWKDISLEVKVWQIVSLFYSSPEETKIWFYISHHDRLPHCLPQHARTLPETNGSEQNSQRPQCSLPHMWHRHNSEPEMLLKWLTPSKTSEAEPAADLTYGQKIFEKKDEIFLDGIQGRGKHFHGMHNFPSDLADSAPGLRDTG